MNKQQVREREKYLVWWKEYMVAEDTWENKENLKNVMEAVEEFEKEYSREKKKETRRQEIKEDRRTFSWELPGRYTAKMLYGWGDKKYKQEYWRRLKENWRQ